MDAAQAPTENDEPQNLQALNQQEFRQHTVRTMTEIRAEFEAAKKEADQALAILLKTKKTAELAYYGL